MSLLALLALPACLSTSEEGDEPVDDTGVPVVAVDDCDAPENTRSEPTAAGAAAVQSVNGVALALLAEHPAENPVVSPLSVSVAIGMTLAGAGGDTADEIRAVFGITDDATFHAGLAELAATLEGVSSDGTGDCPTWQFAEADNAFVDDRLTFAPAYEATLADPYGVTPQLLDFSDATAAADAINAWTSDNTNGRIDDIADPADYNESTLLVLANAVWFYGPWDEAFDPDDTETGPFTLEDGSTVDVPLMRGTGRRGFNSLGDAALVSLPYRGRDLEMVLLVPYDPAGLDAVLATFDLGALDELYPSDVEVTMPRFEVKARASLVDALTTLGMPTVFDAVAADLSGIPAADAEVGNLYVDEVTHVAWISVDEAGTEAAAATTVEVSDTASFPESVEADRPFAYFIRDNVSGVILFAGRLDVPGV